MQSTFGRDRPIAQFALNDAVRSTIEGWFYEENINFLILGETMPEALLGEPMLGPQPIVLELDRDKLTTSPESLKVSLSKLAERAPIIAILDAEMVDTLADFLDVERTEYVAWPCDREAFMSVLQQIESGTSLHEQSETCPGYPDIMRDEVQRIAKALSALVDGRHHVPPVQSLRTAKDSALLLRAIIRKRRARAQFFPADLFADPAWDILLDLAAARLENSPVSVSSLCIAASVPTTTGLRWIKGMTNAGILEREADPGDGRRSFIRLSDKAAEAMENYLTTIGDGVI